MARRSPARYLAPLALVGSIVALYVVVNATTNGDGSREGSATPAASATASPTKKGKKTRKQRRTYVVKPGDTPSSIAEKTNVPLSTIQELNPELDDQTLSVGQKIKLRR